MGQGRVAVSRLPVVVASRVPAAGRAPDAAPVAESAADVAPDLAQISGISSGVRLPEGLQEGCGAIRLPRTSWRLCAGTKSSLFSTCLSGGVVALQVPLAVHTRKGSPGAMTLCKAHRNVQYVQPSALKEFIWKVKTAGLESASQDTVML